MAERALQSEDDLAEQKAPQDAECLDADLIDILGVGSLLRKPPKSHDPRDYRAYQQQCTRHENADQG